MHRSLPTVAFTLALAVSCTTHGAKVHVPRELSESVIPVAIVAWPDADRKPRCRVPQPPDPPDLAGFMELDASRYYLTARQMQDVLEYDRAVHMWLVEVGVCLRTLVRDE